MKPQSIPQLNQSESTHNLPSGKPKRKRKNDRFQSLDGLEETMKEYRYKSSSIASNIRVLKAFENKMSDRPLSVLTPEQAIETAHHYLCQRGLTQAYWVSILNALKLYFRFVRDAELDTQDLKLPAFAEKMPQHLSEEQIQAVIEAFGNVRSREKRLQYKSMFLMLYGTGIRTGELRQLRRGLLESCLGERNLKIPHLNSRDFRHVPFPHQVQEAVSEYLTACNPRTYLFEGITEGTQMSERGIQACMAKVGAMANMDKKVSPNILRNSFATHLLQKGASLEYVSHLMGHKNLSTTRKFLSLAPVFKPDLFPEASGD